MADRIPQVANVVISNVPGPPVALYLAGARMQCNFPTSIVVHGLALNITVESYDQQMDFGLVADALAMPDVRALAKAIEIAFEDLQLLMEPQISAAESLPEALGASVLAAARRRVQAGVDSVSGARRAAQDVVSAAVSNVLSTAVQTAVKEAVGVVTRGTARARAGAPIKQARRR